MVVRNIGQIASIYWVNLFRYPFELKILPFVTCVQINGCLFKEIQGKILPLVGI
jgi:hypothetical protein